jgi:hypothetical protein
VRIDQPVVEPAVQHSPAGTTDLRTRDRFRRSRVDPLGPAIAVLAGYVYWLHGFNGYLSRDLALYAYAGQQVADGLPPYEGVINRSGPLAHIVPGFGSVVGRVLGTDQVLTMRAEFLVLSAVSIWLAYLVGRDLLSSRLSGVASGVALFAVSGFNLYATTGPREKTTLVLLLLCAVLAVGHRRYAWAGGFVSLATLTWQPALFVGAPFAVAALWALPKGTRLRGLGRFTLGGLAPLAGFLVFYAAIGKLRLFLDCFVLIHVEYTQQPGAEQELSEIWDLLKEVYGDFLWSMVIGAVALIVGALVTLALPSRRRDPEYRLVAAGAVGLVGGLAWCLKAFNGFPDVFFLLPMTVLGVGYVTREIRDLLTKRVALVLVAAWLVVATVGEYHFAREKPTEWLPVQRAEVEAVFDILPPDATIVSVEAPQPLVLTSRTNPLPHQMFAEGLDGYVDATWPGGLMGFADDMDRLKPTIIARGTTRPIWLGQLLAKDYWRVGTTPGWTWYVRRSIDPEIRDAMVRAVNDG